MPESNPWHHRALHAVLAPKILAGSYFSKGREIHIRIMFCSVADPVGSGSVFLQGRNSGILKFVLPLSKTLTWLCPRGRFFAMCTCNTFIWPMVIILDSNSELTLRAREIKLVFKKNIFLVCYCCRSKRMPLSGKKNHTTWVHLFLSYHIM